MLPRDLKIDSTSARIILESEHREALEVTSRLFRSLEDPVLLNQIANSFRGHIFVEAPSQLKGVLGRVSGAFKGEGFVTPFIDFKEAAPAFIKKLELSEEELINIWNVYTAIRKNIDEGFIENRNQRYLLALFLSKSEGKLPFATSAQKSRMEYSVLEFAAKIVGSIDRVLAAPAQRTILDKLIHDEGYVVELQEIVKASEGQGVRSGIVSKIGKASYRLKADFKSELIASLVLNNLLTETASRLGLFEEAGLTIRGERDAFLHALEEHLLEALTDKSIAAETMSMMDKLIFNTPLPMDGAMLSRRVSAGALKYWLPAKVDASTVKSQEREVETASLLVEQNVFSSATTVRSYEMIRPDSTGLQVRNPNKRRQRGRDRRETVEERESEEIISFAEDLVPVAGVEYEFHFLRSMSLGTQKIIFSEEVVVEMKRQNALWRTFLAPINYGFTSSSGQSGIKTLNSNDNRLRNDLYEVRPGNHDYRMFMIRDGNQWTVVKMIHHNNVRREIPKI